MATKKSTTKSPKRKTASRAESKPKISKSRGVRTSGKGSPRHKSTKKKQSATNLAQVNAKFDHIKDSDKANLRVLAVDIGGTKVKMLLNGELEARKALTGPEFTPMDLLKVVNELTTDWEFDAITIGFPGLVGPNGPVAEPGNLGPGWVGFDFAGAFQRPVKILNDAAMQAVGSYEGGRMLFLGVGTGLGTTLIVDHVILDCELGGLRWNSRKTIGELLSKRSIKKLGLRKWREAVRIVVHDLMAAFVADYVVVGGGNAKLIDSLPAGARLGHNQTAFRGGFRVWGVDNQSSENLELHGNWRVL